MKNKSLRFVYYIDGKAKAYKGLKYRKNGNVLLLRHQIEIGKNGLDISIKVKTERLLKG